MPRFSLITTVYNNEKYFPIAARSILSQDFEDFEYIIVDDGSTDNTSHIVDDIANHDKRVHVIHHQNNQWIYAGFNTGIMAAKGEYILIVNSDDKLKPGSLSILEKKIQKYNPDIILMSVFVHSCDFEQKILRYDIYNMRKLDVKETFFKGKKNVRNNWLYFYKNSYLNNQANLYKREIMQKYKFRNDIYAADTLFNISIASDLSSALVIKEILYEHFIYNIENMNASVGKYYGYEHYMFDELYLEYVKLYKSWNCYELDIQKFLKKERLKKITTEIRSLLFKNCNLSTEQKIKKIFSSIIDEFIYQCACDIDAIEELESRVLSGIRELLIIEELSFESEMYFAYELLESLLRYEKETEDYKRIEKALNNPYNKFHIGKCFYEKLNINL